MASATEIKTALSLLDPKNDEHWTQDGLPVIAILQQAVDGQITRAEVTAADPQFNRATALAAADNAAQAAAAQKAKEAEQAAKSQTEQPLPTGAGTPLDFDALSAKCDEAQKVVEQREAAVHAAKLELDKANAARDALVRVRDTAIPPHVNQQSIMSYLERQKQVRAEKAARTQAIMAAGITPEMLKGKAPIDNAMARKRGFGLNRPQVPFQQK